MLTSVGCVWILLSCQSPGRKPRPLDWESNSRKQVEISTITPVKGADLETKNDNLEDWDEIGQGGREMFFLWGFNKEGLRIDTPGETPLEAQQGESWHLNLEAGRCTAGNLTSD